MEKYIVAVRRNDPKLDFAALVEGIPGLEIKRSGPLRRVTVFATTDAIDEARKRLPKTVIIEREVTFHQS